MLFEAFFWDIATARPTLASFRERAEFSQLLDGWGRAGDLAIISAANDGARLGAAWFRLWTPEVHSYGFVDANIPEVGMAVVGAHRSRASWIRFPSIRASLLRAVLHAVPRTCQSSPERSAWPVFLVASRSPACRTRPKATRANEVQRDGSQDLSRLFERTLST
jgi:hypothetical protein